MPLPAIGVIAAYVGAALIASIVARILLALGIGVVIYTGSEDFFNAVQNQVLTQWQGLPADFAAIFGLLGIDVLISLIFSAYSIVFVFKFTGGFGFKALLP